MSVRQYIGARYMPKFVGVYDNTQAYDVLDVVDNGLGTSYIARIPTPPNTPLTDTSHWMVYGSSSGAVLDLQARVTSLENDDVAIKASILNIGGQVATNTGNIADNTGDITDIKQNMEYLGVVNKVIFVGDSFLVRNDNNIATAIMSDMGIPSADAVISCLGSTGFAHANTGTTFLTLLQNVADTFVKSEVSHIFFIAGGNDYAETDVDINNAINTCINYIKATFPNATTYISFCAGCLQSTKIREYARACKAYQIACLNHDSVRFCEGVQYIQRSRPGSYFDSDGVHPTAEGGIAIGHGIAECVKHGCIVPTYFYTQSDVLPSRSMYFNYNGSQVMAWTNNYATIAFSPSITLVSGQDVELCTLDSNVPIDGSYYGDCGTNVAAVVLYNNSANSLTIGGCVFIQARKLLFRPVWSGNIANVNGLRLPQFCIVFDSMMC